MSSIVPLWYKSTQAFAPQSKMLAARAPSDRERKRCRGSHASNSRSKSGNTSSAAAFSRSLSGLHPQGHEDGLDPPHTRMIMGYTPVPEDTSASGVMDEEKNGIRALLVNVPQSEGLRT